MPSIIPEIITSTRRSSLTAAISSSLTSDNQNASNNTFSFSPSNNSNNSIAGLYGDPAEPLRPTTRTLQRHIMERTISEILSDLEYAMKRKEEYRDKCKYLYSRIQKLEDTLEQMESLRRVDKEFEDLQWEEIKNLKIDYIDLHQRYEKLYSKYVLVNDEITLSDLV